MGNAASSQPQATSLPSAEQTIEANTTRSGEAVVSTAIQLDVAELPSKSIDHTESIGMNEPQDEHSAQGHLSHRNIGDEERSDASTSRRRTSESDDGEIESAADKDQMMNRRRSQPQQQPEQTLAEFKEGLRVKREQRLSAIADLKNEVLQLRQELAAERAISQQLRQSQGIHIAATQEDTDCTDHCGSGANEDDVRTIIDAVAPATTTSTDGEAATMPCSASATTTELRAQLADTSHELQLANAENLSLSTELTITQRQVTSLKEVIVVTKEMVAIRESQLEQLKSKLKTIEDSLAERELTLMSDTLRKEYDRQLANIRSLRTLYEERSRVNAAEKENLMRQLDTKRTEMEAEIEKCTNLEARVATLEKELEQASINLTNTKDDLLDSNSVNKSLQEDSAVINKLFSQLLSGFSGGNDVNIDKLASMLEDNRDLLSDITNRETCRDGAAALPKLLFDLVSQVEATEEPSADSSTAENNTDSETEVNATTSTAVALPTTTVSAKEIVHNLPKVWKVLIELLNHQKTEPVPFNENGDSVDCYNLVQSPTGPQQVLSVSKTYIRLKDLIVEKKSLQKETNKLKNLNSHLETRLDTQEKRLAAVTVELNKTWTLVGRMQRQHRQLHTHEQVLRYQLSQKRRLLNELKEELEYCRRKWTLAREKNDESQTQWDTLRQEFNARKLQDAGSQNSTESGFSDDPASDDDGSEVVHATESKDEAVETPIIVSQPVVVYTAAEVTAQQDDGAGASGLSKESHPVLSRELRKKKPKPKKAKNNGAETLEEMFYRLSGQEAPAESSSESSSDEEFEVEIEELNKEEEVQEMHSLVVIPEEIVVLTDDEAVLPTESDNEALSDYVDPEDEERRQKRAIRFARLEEQCNQLISQVMRTASRGEELNKQLDVVHNRYRTPTRDTTSTADGSSSAINQGASTSSGVQDTACLTEKEQEFTSRRAARLKRLEEECKAFLDKVSATNMKATDLNTKMDHLHEQHSARMAERVTGNKQDTCQTRGAATSDSDSLPVEARDECPAENERIQDSSINDNIVESETLAHNANAELSSSAEPILNTSDDLPTESESNTEEIPTTTLSISQPDQTTSTPAETQDGVQDH